MANYTLPFAQLPDGSVAPDFVVVDIFGESHHLYSYLEEGKTVIIEVAATWCNPCWAYTQVGSLEEAHQVLGPDGLDNLIVLFIEGEPENGIDQLYGIAGTSGAPYADLTSGNWVESINYPIIDNSAIADLFEINYYPTIFKICPNEKTLTEIDQIPLSTILDEVLNIDCMTPAANHDLAILQYKGTESVCGNTPFKTPLEIINLGPSMTSQATIETSNSSELLMIDTITNFLIPFQRKVIQLGELELDNVSTLGFRLFAAVDNNPHNNYLSQELHLAPKAIGEMVELTIHTDGYGFEMYWQIRNTDGVVFCTGGNTEVGISNGGPPYINAPYAEGAYDDFSTVNHEFYLPANDCYELVMVDDYGDGICCEYGDGSYEIKDEVGNILISGGLFSDYIIHPFSIEPSSTATENNLTEPILCYPNPADDFITLDQIPFENKPLTMVVFNMVGQQIHQQTVDSKKVILSTDHYPTGIYLVHLLSDNGTPIYSQKITIQ